MTRPALLLLAAALMLSAAAQAETTPAKGRCPGLASFKAGADKIKAPSGDWKTDLGKANPLCEDAVWRVVGSDGVKAQWDALPDAAAQAAFLGKAAAAIEKYDQDTEAGLTAAKAVFEAGQKAGIVTEVTPGQATVAGRGPYPAISIKTAVPDVSGAGDLDKASMAWKTRKTGLEQLLVPAVPDQSKVVGGEPKVIPGSPAKPGPAVVAFYKAMDAARADLALLAPLGAKVPEIGALIQPKSPTGLSLKVDQHAKELAEAATWEDADPAKGALMAFGDLGRRNTWAIESANVKIVADIALRISGDAYAKGNTVETSKSEALAKANADLHAALEGATGLREARGAFDNEKQRNEGYADTTEAKHRAQSLGSAGKAVDGTKIVQDADGSYRVVGADGKEYAKGLGSLEAAKAKANDLTADIAKDIIAGNPILASARAAYNAVMLGDVPPPAGGAPNTFKDGGCAAADTKAESLDDYKQRMLEGQMAGAADRSRVRQAAERELKDKMARAKKQYDDNCAVMGATGCSHDMNNPKDAERLYLDAKDKAYKEFRSATGVSMDEEIARKTADAATLDLSATHQFVDMIKGQAPQLAKDMPGNLRAGKHRDFFSPTEVAVILRPIPNGETGATRTYFDDFIAQQWTDGDQLQKNAEWCAQKGNYKAGDYDSLEHCAASTLRQWLNGLKGAKPPVSKPPVGKPPTEEKPSAKPNAGLPVNPDDAVEDADKR